MKYLLFSILCLCTQIALCQEIEFQYQITKPETSEIAQCAIEGFDNNLYVLSSSTNISSGQSFSNLYKYSLTGELLCEKEFYDENGIILIDIIEHDHKYWIAGSIGNSNSDLVDFYLCSIDENLNKLSEYRIAINADRIERICSIIDNSNNLVFACEAVETISQKVGSFLIKFDYNGLKINEKQFEKTTRQSIQGFVENLAKNGYLLFLFRISDSTGDIIATDGYIELYNDFNVKDTVIFESYKGGRNTINWITDSTLVLSGSIYRSGYYDLAIREIKLPGNIIKHKTYGERYIWEYEALCKSCDLIDKENVFLAGITPFEWGYFTPNWYYIIKLDSNFEQKCETMIGGDAYHLLYGIVATSDGGCFLYGIRLDTKTQKLQDFDLHLLKIRNSEPFGVESENINKSEVMVYPMPCKDNLYLKNIPYGEVVVEIYDLNGKLILTKNTIAENLCINTSGLHAGVYIINVKQNNSIIKSDKWIKQ